MSLTRMATSTTHGIDWDVALHRTIRRDVAI
jgi:hypothetical protein